MRKQSAPSDKLFEGVIFIQENISISFVAFCRAAGYSQ